MGQCGQHTQPNDIFQTVKIRTVNHAQKILTLLSTLQNLVFKRLLLIVNCLNIAWCTIIVFRLDAKLYIDA